MDKDEWYETFGRAAAAACGKTPEQVLLVWADIERHCELRRKEGISPYAVAARHHVESSPGSRFPKGVNPMIWERAAYNLHRQGLSPDKIQERLGADSKGYLYDIEDILYAIELCSNGPVPGYEREEHVHEKSNYRR